MLSIIYEDDFIVAVNKQAGLISENSQYERDSVENRVRAYLELSKKKAFVGVIHRLDRVTSGILLFAKKKSSLVAFNQLFEAKKVQKTYHALVNTLPFPNEGKLSNFLLKNNLDKRTDVVAEGTPHAKLAELSYRLIQSYNSTFLLEIKPTTGRFHQIRAQLAFINQPIMGDKKYGSTIIYSFKGIALHAKSLEFIHPFFEGEEIMKLSAPAEQLLDKKNELQ